MGLRLTELDEYFDPGFTVTVLGVEYTIPLASAELGLWCRRLAALSGEVDEDSTDAELQAAGKNAREKAAELPPLPGDEDLSFEERMLGKDTLADMVANEVPDPYVQFCAQTAFVRILGGEPMAERYWTSGGRPQPPGPANRAARRATKKTTSRKASGSATTSTAAAATTRARASSSGTSTPSRSAKSAPASRSPGRRS